ncbi:unnamed protein product, partial [Rotaria sordida]
SSHFIYSIAKFLLASGHELETHALAALEPVVYDLFLVEILLELVRYNKDQSLLNIYSTQLILFDVGSSFELRPIDPFIVAFRASTNRNLNNFEKILNDFRQSLVHDETVYRLDIFSYLTSLNEYFKLLL